MIEAFLTNPFLYMALLAGFAASITSGIMGSFVVIKRIVFISGSIAHSVLGGMGFFLWLGRTYNIPWITPMQGAIVAALISALLIGWIHLEYREREDTVIAALWSTGMSIGVIFIALTPGYSVELMHYLFGNILWVTRADILILLTLDVIVIAIIALFRHQFLAICFDEQQAKLQKVRVKCFYLLLLCLIALSVVLLIQVVGAVLVIAMLAIPAAIASGFTHRFTKMMIFAVLIGCFFTLLGTTTSYQLNWPPGATIALVAAVFYLLSFSVKRRLH
ncbi:MAG: High-affinity zinc uptake system membrane protein ZnuB [Chlamydiae bacterium]|nr:High-affinity zinc uptake system membrane protein ZnuB [Chlamydiota bacterium]